jgi:hypothetical protein
MSEDFKSIGLVKYFEQYRIYSSKIPDAPHPAYANKSTI